MSDVDQKIGSFIELSDEHAKSSIIVGNIENSESKELNAVFKSISDIAFFDTGILPLDGSGTLMIRQALGHCQVVFQHKPGIYRVIWGGHEGDKEAVHYELAMPYRIVIGDFVDNEFYGARHFYSPTPITNLDQVMFHVNLPNLNCKGYGHGNGVGWICLYHNKPSIASLDLGQKIANLIERAGGGEAYNDANMKETDGPRFYEEKYASNLEFEYLWNPESWESMSLSNGIDWVLDPDLWIPVVVKGLDDQCAHHDGDDGSYLTLRMAVEGKYNAYYGDTHKPKNYQKFIRKDLDSPSNNLVFNKIQSAFKKAQPEVIQEQQIHKPIVPFSSNFATCKICQEVYGSSNVVPFENGSACISCAETVLGTCASCDQHKHYADMAYYKNNFQCSSCVKLFQCKNCFSFHIDETSIINETMCSACTTGSIVECAGCLIPHESEKLTNLNVKDPFSGTVNEIKLCLFCVGEYFLCSCQCLVPINDVIYAENAEFGVCNSCYNELKHGSLI